MSVRAPGTSRYFLRLFLVVLFAGLGITARAGIAAPASYPIKLFRWDEDYSFLRGKQDLPFPLSLKYVPLGGAEEFAYVSFGGEYKLRIESYDRPNFALNHAQDFSALSQRVLVHTDIHPEPGFRIFVQLGFSNETGRKPVERPFDKGGLDLAQGFVDWNFAAGGEPWRIRLGRQELGIGRYITIREGTAIRRTFDGARVDGAVDAWTLTAFAARPTKNRRAAFDDEPDPSDFVAAFVFGRPLPGLESLRADFIALMRDFKNARYLPGPGRERRDTLGMHLYGTLGPWDANLQASHEFGTFTPLSGKRLTIDASGAAFEGGYTFAHWPTVPRIGFRLDAAEGDGNPSDRTLSTFDLPYPDLTYLTDAAIIAPRNVWDIDPFFALHPIPSVALTLGSQFLWRLTPKDAVFTPLGTPLLPAGGHGNFVAAQPYARLIWDPWSFAEWQAAVVRAQPGDAVKSFGGKAQTYFSSSLTVRF